MRGVATALNNVAVTSTAAAAALPAIASVKASLKGPDPGSLVERDIPLDPYRRLGFRVPAGSGTIDGALARVGWATPTYLEQLLRVESGPAASAEAYKQGYIDA